MNAECAAVLKYKTNVAAAAAVDLTLASKLSFGNLISNLLSSDCSSKKGDMINEQSAGG